MQKTGPRIVWNFVFISLTSRLSRDFWKSFTRDGNLQKERPLDSQYGWKPSSRQSPKAPDEDGVSPSPPRGISGLSSELPSLSVNSSGRKDCIMASIPLLRITCGSLRNPTFGGSGGVNALFTRRWKMKHLDSNTRRSKITPQVRGWI